MYLRETSRKNQDGSKVTYYQLAETIWNPQTKRPEAKIIHNFGRADQLDKSTLERLAKSILRVCEVPEPLLYRDSSIKLLSSKAYGGIYVLDHIWEELGISSILRRALRKEGYETPLERAAFLMVANRALSPLSKLSCYEKWLSEEVYFPIAEEMDLHHLYRAMDFLEAHKEEIEKEIFWQVADLIQADVDLIFYDTTSIYFEVEEEDKSHKALRRRGHSKDHREDQPQIVVGLAVTRDGLPVRSWVFPGNTADISTISQVKKDLKGWRLNRCVFVGDRGMVSEQNLKELSAGGGRYILGVPMRKFKEVSKEVLSRAGRFSPVKENLHVKEVFIPHKEGGERKRRYIVCYNPEEAERDRKKRERHLKMLQTELDILRERKRSPTKAVCTLLKSRRFGPYLKLSKNGLPKIDQAKIKVEERLDGKYVLMTNDDTLTAEDTALGYRHLMRVERAFRDLKNGMDIRPIYHFSPDRIKAHVTLCVLSLLLIRVAELRAQDSWRNIKHSLETLKLIHYQTNSKGIFQTTERRQKLNNLLNKLKIKPPKKILTINEA